MNNYLFESRQCETKVIAVKSSNMKIHTPVP